MPGWWDLFLMEPARSDRPNAWRAGLGAALVAGLVAFCVLRLQVVTDITAFMADVADPKLAALSRGMASSELTRTLVLSVSDERGEPDVAIAGAQALADRLQDRLEVAWLRTGPGELHAEAIHNLYYPRRFFLLADETAWPSGQVVRRRPARRPPASCGASSACRRRG